jgi:hypothetical protein
MYHTVDQVCHGTRDARASVHLSQAAQADHDARFRDDVLRLSV